MWQQTKKTLITFNKYILYRCLFQTVLRAKWPSKEQKRKKKSKENKLISAHKDIIFYHRIASFSLFDETHSGQQNMMLVSIFLSIVCVSCQHLSPASARGLPFSSIDHFLLYFTTNRTNREKNPLRIRYMWVFCCIPWLSNIWHNVFGVRYCTPLKVLCVMWYTLVCMPLQYKYIYVKCWAHTRSHHHTMAIRQNVECAIGRLFGERHDIWISA